LSIGLDSKFARKVIDAGFTLTKLKDANQKDLKQYFTSKEIELINNRIKRRPIPQEVVQRLVEECLWRCCACKGFHSEKPVVIHHIDKHSKTYDAILRTVFEINK
jgi:hypothetical protein